MAALSKCNVNTKRKHNYLSAVCAGQHPNYACVCKI